MIFFEIIQVSCIEGKIGQNHFDCIPRILTHKELWIPRSTLTQAVMGHRLLPGDDITFSGPRVSRPSAHHSDQVKEA